MYAMRGRSRIIATDEKVIVRRENDTLGNQTIIVDGKRVRRGHTEFALRCNIQPAGGDDTMMEAAGDRFNEQLICFADDRDNPLAPNDLLFRPDDGWYQLMECGGWGTYTRARIQRVEVGPLKSEPSGPSYLSQPDLELLSTV